MDVLCQGTDTLINSIYAAVNTTDLKCMPIKLTDKCMATTPCILEVKKMR